MALLQTCLPSLKMATISSFTLSPKTLTLTYHPKTPSFNFNPLSIKSKPNSRNPIRIQAVLDEDYSSKRSSSNEQRETIMLPGCDYNHWLIVMEFPKDPAPSREQMIDTYLQTLATVLGRFYFAPFASNFVFHFLFHNFE
jgi:hypothetical protein